MESGEGELSDQERDDICELPPGQTILFTPEVGMQEVTNSGASDTGLGQGGSKPGGEPVGYLDVNYRCVEKIKNILLGTFAQVVETVNNPSVWQIWALNVRGVRKIPSNSPSGVGGSAANIRQRIGILPFAELQFDDSSLVNHSGLLAKLKRAVGT